MHLSDGTLDAPTVLLTAAAAAGSVGVSLWQLRRQREFAAPSAGRMAFVGGAVFAAQAINFPIADGVSGHLLGGVAAAVLLGPWAGTLVVSTVLAVQCLLLGDGGLSALGANVLNMAVLGSLLGYPVWRMNQRGTAAARRAVVAAFAGAASLTFGAVACAMEMQFSGRADFFATAGHMVPLHLLLGVAEGLFTAAAVLLAARSAEATTRVRRNALSMLAILAVVAILVPYSSALPDTLEAAIEPYGIVAAEPYVAAVVVDDTFSAAGGWGGAVLPIGLGASLAFSTILVLDRGISRSAARISDGRVAR